MRYARAITAVVASVLLLSCGSATGPEEGRVVFSLEAENRTDSDVTLQLSADTGWSGRTFQIGAGDELSRSIAVTSSETVAPPEVDRIVVAVRGADREPFQAAVGVPANRLTIVIRSEQVNVSVN